MGSSPAAHDPSVAVRRRHLPSFAWEENEKRASKAMAPLYPFT